MRATCERSLIVLRAEMAYVSTLLAMKFPHHKLAIKFPHHKLAMKTPLNHLQKNHKPQPTKLSGGLVFFVCTLTLVSSRDSEQETF